AGPRTRSVPLFWPANGTKVPLERTDDTNRALASCDDARRVCDAAASVGPARAGCGRCGHTARFIRRGVERGTGDRIKSTVERPAASDEDRRDRRLPVPVLAS